MRLSNATDVLSKRLGLGEAVGGAILLAVAIGCFYLGSLTEFQLGAYAPDWTKTLLFYSPPKSNVDFSALNELFTTIEQHYVKTNLNGTKLTEGAASGMVCHSQ